MVRKKLGPPSARAEGGRRFQREGPATEKDLYLATVVLVRGTNSSRLSNLTRSPYLRRGRRNEVEVRSRMASRRYLGVTPHLAFKDNKEKFALNASRDCKPMEMFLDVRRYTGVTGKSGNESRSLVEYSLTGEIAGS